jgi:hypothetical protein
MTDVVSCKEFVGIEAKYFDMALSEKVFIKRGDFTYSIQVENKPRRKYKEPDEDFYRAISMEEFEAGVLSDLKEYFNNRGK